MLMPCSSFLRYQELLNKVALKYPETHRFFSWRSLLIKKHEIISLFSQRFLLRTLVMIPRKH